jgi:hypothetical protein
VKTFRSIYTFCGGAALAGLGLIAAGYRYPVHRDEARAAVLRGPGGCVNGEPLPGWYDQMAALETLRHPLMQAGASLVLAAATILAIHLAFVRPGTVPWATPARRWQFIGTALLALALNWLGFVYGLGLDQNRGAFPWCEDSIGIPIFGVTPMYLLLAAVMVAAGWVLTRRFGALPASLIPFERPKTARGWAGALILVPGAIGMLAVAALDAVSSSFLATPSYILLAYLFLSTRAALLANAGRGDQNWPDRCG